MTTAREIMTGRPAHVSSTDSVVDAARQMRDFSVGALPVCDEDDQLTGIVTDRDIVVRCVAHGDDPGATAVATVVDGGLVTVAAEASLEEALSLMIEHAVRRLPVVDHGHLIGMVSQADVTRALPDRVIGTLIAALTRKRMPPWPVRGSEA